VTLGASDATALHRDAIVVDGLVVSNWSRGVFEAMRGGGLSAANCTCSVWENFRDTCANLAHWERWFSEHGDLIVKVRTTADIARAKRDGKVGVILGFQNTSAFEDRLETIAFFKAVGVGIAQMTYNTQNLVGSGCYESRDGGLSDWGREVVAEMNRVGMLCDLSHVGPNTSRDVILASSKPVAYTHCLPAGLKAHPRNKSDDELRFIAEHGGFVGVTMFPPFLARGPEARVDDVVAAIDYVIDLVGEDCVGIGTDFTQGHGEAFFEWITRDKGDARKLTEFGEISFPDGLQTLADWPNLTAAMAHAGWPEDKIRKVLGRNWLRLLDAVWGESGG
jgi:membrane dipeptidase